MGQVYNAFWPNTNTSREFEQEPIRAWRHWMRRESKYHQGHGRHERMTTRSPFSWHHRPVSRRWDRSDVVEFWPFSALDAGGEGLKKAPRFKGRWEGRGEERRVAGRQGTFSRVSRGAAPSGFVDASPVLESRTSWLWLAVDREQLAAPFFADFRCFMSSQRCLNVFHEIMNFQRTRSMISS